MGISFSKTDEWYQLPPPGHPKQRQVSKLLQVTLLSAVAFSVSRLYWEEPSSLSFRMLFHDENLSHLFDEVMKPRQKICFIQSVFGDISHPSLDKPFNATPLRTENPDFEFFYFTNMPQLETPGWIKILMPDEDFAPIQSHIVMSRLPKFLAWKIHAPIQEECRIVMYIDGYYRPTANRTRFDHLASIVEQSEFGIVQDPHPRGGNLTTEFQRILISTKDTKAHVDASLDWLRSRPDWNNTANLYWNAIIAYDPSSVHYQTASEFFWERYRKELDSWRDQPLWAYSLHHFGFRALMLKEETLHSYITQDHHRMGIHKYDEDSASYSNQAAPSVQAMVTQCKPITKEEKEEITKEIKDYEKSPKFKAKQNEVMGTAKIAAHHAAIVQYLKAKVLQPNWNILELGCAAGSMLNFVQQLYEENPESLGTHGDLVGVELVTGWVKFAQEYFPSNGNKIHVFEGDVTEFSLPEPYRKTYDFVMLNDVMEHIQKTRYGCFYEQIKKVTHPGSVVYMHTPTPSAQIVDKDQYFENVLPHHHVVMGMALAGFELVEFTMDVDTVCGSHLGDVPRMVKEAKCGMGGWAKYYHAVFVKQGEKHAVFKLN